MTNGASGAIELSLSLRRRPEFIAACKDRDVGAILALVKKYTGVSQVRIAAALDMTPSRVGELIGRKRQVISMEVLERISDRLRIPGLMLGLAPRPWEAQSDADELGEVGFDDIAAILGHEELDVSAESPLRIAHSWLLIEPPQAAELTSGRHIGHALVQRVEARVRHLRRMDDVIGGRDSFAIVTREVDATAAAIRDGSYAEPIRSALLVALAELCQLAGWVLDDAGRHDQATRYFLAGVQAGQEAGDPSLAANLLSTLSYQRANTGHEHDAVLLARSAALTGGPYAPPAGRALLWDRTAWAHARKGEPDLCYQALEAADEAYDQADEERPPWAYWLDRGELDVMAGRCYTQLDQPDRAEPLLRAAISAYDASHSREVALYRSWLAEAYAKAGDVEHACAEITKILDAVEGVNSARVEKRVMVLRRALRPYADVQAVREIEERARTLMRTA